MLIIPPPKRVKKQPTMKPPAAVPPSGPLVLVSASATAGSMTLTFDRAMSASGIVVSQFIYNDPVTTNQQYIGTGTVIVLGPTEIRVRLAAAGAATGTIQSLTAGAANGLVAVDDSGTWPGVSGLPLPFGG